MVPAPLVLQTPAPRLSGTTNEHLVKWAEAMGEALGQCNADKKSIAGWSLKLPAAD